MRLIKLDLAFCLIIICILFIPTLTRPWLIFDESIIYSGEYFPAPRSLGELFEIIKEFGLNHYLISSHPLYNFNYALRNCPLGQFLGMLSDFFLKKNAFAYHTFNLVLHLINTCLVFLIIKAFTPALNRFLVIIFTLLWAVHPVNIESIMLSTNWEANFCYLIYFFLLLDFINNYGGKPKLIRKIGFGIIFLLALLQNEQIVMLPVILFVFSFYKSYKQSNFKESLFKSTYETIHYFAGFLFFAVIFPCTHPMSQNHTGNDIVSTLERIFWLSPQIFFHYLKLIFYPKILSIDQTLYVHLTKKLLDPYSIFSTTLFLVWLLLPLILFLSKKKLSNVFFLTWAFFFALLPFLHIVTPLYTLATERYLYCPLALFSIGLGKIISTFETRILFFSLILALCFGRSYYRTLDWKDNYSFINSNCKENKDPLIQAMRFSTLGKASKNKEYFLKSLEYLKIAKENTIKEKKKYQQSLPKIIKAYRLDYDSILSQIAYIEASTRCTELNENYTIGLSLLRPYIEDLNKTDPVSIDLYSHLLIFDKKYTEAKDLLLKANSIYPHLHFILLDLFDIYIKYEKDRFNAEKFIVEAMRLYPYDSTVLLKALAFYSGGNNLPLIAKYSYLYGLRTHSIPSYKEALYLYLDLGELNYAKNILNKLLKLNPNDEEIILLSNKYYYKMKEKQKTR